MDADANYREIVELWKILTDTENIRLCGEDENRFAELWEELFQWLKRGGFSPMNIPGELPQYFGRKFIAFAAEWQPGRFCLHFVKPGSKAQHIFYLR